MTGSESGVLSSKGAVRTARTSNPPFRHHAEKKGMHGTRGQPRLLGAAQVVWHMRARDPSSVESRWIAVHGLADIVFPSLHNPAMTGM